MYYKNIFDGYLESVSTGNGTNLITEAEYNEILAIAQTAPTAPDGYVYKLKADTFEWILIETPPMPEPEDDATEDDYQRALKQMGVNFNEDQ